MQEELSASGIVTRELIMSDSEKDLRAKRLAKAHAAINNPDVAEFSQRRVGRNDPCPCGSGKKFKKCCLGQEWRREMSPATETAEEERHEAVQQ